MLVIKLIHPTLARLIHMIPFSVRMIIGIVLLTLLCLDFLISIISVHGILQENKQVQFVLGHLGRLGEKLAASLSSLHNRTKEPRHIKWYKKHLNKTKRSSQKQKAGPLPFGAGKSVYKLFWIFIIGSVIGYIVETIFIYLTTGIWMNRSSLLYGPFSVVWGLGAVVLTLVLYGWNEKSDRYIFLGGLVDRRRLRIRLQRIYRIFLRKRLLGLQRPAFQHQRQSQSFILRLLGVVGTAVGQRDLSLYLKSD